jgi:hypothetical protein
MPKSLIPPPIVPLEILGAIRASTYRLLFEAHGYPVSLAAKKRTSATLETLVAAPISDEGALHVPTAGQRPPTMSSVLEARSLSRRSTHVSTTHSNG